MSRINVGHKTALQEIVANVPKAKRQALKYQITILQELFGDTQDLFSLDRRGSHWATKAKSEATKAKMKNTWETKRATDIAYRVSWRSGGSHDVSLNQAAEYVKKDPRKMARAISLAGGKVHYVDEPSGDIVTITKI